MVAFFLRYLQDKVLVLWTALEKLSLAGGERTCRLATRLCSFSALGFEWEGLPGAARELGWGSSPGPREASSWTPGQSVENSSTLPSHPRIFSSSSKLVLLFSGLVNNRTEGKTMRCGAAYLPGLQACLHLADKVYMQSRHRQGASVTDSDQPKAPRLQHSCHTAFITHVTSDGLEGVLSVESPVNTMGVLWDHRHGANLHFSFWSALLSGVWGWCSLHTLYTALTGRERRMPATTLKIWKTREKKRQNLIIWENLLMVLKMIKGNE